MFSPDDMHKPENILEKEMYKILWDDEVQTRHVIPARKTIHSWNK